MSEDARESYAKLHANTSGPSHQGETSQEAQAALNEIDRLRSWSRAAFAAGYWAGRFWDGDDEAETVDEMFDEWQAALASENTERYQRMQTFVRWMTADVNIRRMALGVCEARGLENIGVLARDQPEAFDELYEAAADFLEQAPTEDVPGFMR